MRRYGSSLLIDHWFTAKQVDKTLLKENKGNECSRHNSTRTTNKRIEEAVITRELDGAFLGGHGRGILLAGIVGTGGRWTFSIWRGVATRVAACCMDEHSTKPFYLSSQIKCTIRYPFLVAMCMPIAKVRNQNKHNFSDFSFHILWHFPWPKFLLSTHIYTVKW